MSKILVIGDIHGNNKWKKIIHKHADADVVVFVGDYFDSKAIYVSGDRQLENFEEILSLKRGDFNRFFLLIGNHDYHYFSFCKENYGGYQSSHAKLFQIKLERAFAQNFIQMAYEKEGYLFSHAGISKSWCVQNKLPMQNLVEEVNVHFKRFPKSFKLSQEEPFSPIWIRPEALENDSMENFIQVVGHTQQMDIVVKSNLILVDALNTAGKYLVIQNNNYLIEKV